MEIKVDEVDGLPAHTYLSIRYGEQRRQAPFRSGETLTFRAVDGSVERTPKSYTIDVLRKVGSKQVSLAGITALGGAVKSEALEIPSLEINGSPITVDMSARLLQQEGARQEPDQSKRQQVARKAKEYLDSHSIQPVLNDMFAKLLESQPSDPLAFMVEFLELQREQAEMAEDAEVERHFASEPGLGPKALPGFADGRSSEDLPDLSHHHSLVTDLLRADLAIYERLRDGRTTLGVSLAQCLKPGMDCPGHELMKVPGVYAGDAECYEMYADVFVPTVKALHPCWTPQAPHARDNHPGKLTNSRIDATGRYAVYATVETRRNFRGFRFPACCSKAERREVERVFNGALAAAGRGDHLAALRGSYLPLRHSQSHAARRGGMTSHQEKRLRGAGMLFTEPDSRLRLAAGFGRDWPDARGVFVSESQGVYLWCNEEDHLRFFARQHTVVDLKKLWGEMSEVVAAIAEGAGEAGGGFAWSNQLGYLTSCPSRLGPATRITVSLKVPLLAASVDLVALCSSLDLQVNPVAGPMGNVWSVSNGDCLGMSEVDMVNGVIEGCAALVQLEERLERGEAIHDAMPGLGKEAMPGFPVDRPAPLPMQDLTGKRSALAVVLRESPEIYSKLRKKATASGVRFAACIKPGMDDRGQLTSSSAGVVAADETCYETFRELFEPVIQLLHGRALPTAQPHDVDVTKITSSGPPANFAVASWVELRRNLRGLRMAPCCGMDERREVERLVTKALFSIVANDGCDARYVPLSASNSFVPQPGGADFAEDSALRAENLSFGAPTTALQLSAGIGREWPDARGVWLSEDGRDVVLWCNEEDHVRIRVRRAGADVHGAFERATQVAQKLQSALEALGSGFAEDPSLGFLTVDPCNLGAALRCSMELRLPRLGARPADLEAVAKGLKVQVSRMQGGHWDVASGSTLGVSEVHVANELINGCGRIAELEDAAVLGNEALQAKMQAFRPCSRAKRDPGVGTKSP